jgi:DNA-directed RNA polymerase subunit L
VRPRISDAIPGEQLKLTAEFSVHTAKDNNMFNVVSKCAYGNTIDIVKVNEIWETQENKYKSENISQSDIEFHKKNFYILDAQRLFIENSFDFVIQTLGVYDNIEIVKKACLILQNKFVDFIKSIDSGIVPINISETIMDNSYDIILENEDYTIGKVIEYILYEKYYMGDKMLAFCGFKKFHPHDSDVVNSVADKASAEKQLVSQHLRIACIEAGDVFKKVYQLFSR